MKVIRNAVCICMLVIALMPVFAAGNAENASNSGGRQEVRVLLWDSIYNSTIEPNGIEAKFEAAYPQYDVVFDRIDYDNLDKQILLSIPDRLHNSPLSEVLPLQNRSATRFRRKTKRPFRVFLPRRRRLPSSGTTPLTDTPFPARPSHEEKIRRSPVCA